ncbi:MAG: imidazole glycerol-phosphate synthase subunit HisH [Actinomycetota bacterium]|nr:imidazole glycerol-phosphate synthase subunit HisH [Actinomycetota bacterium]
MNKVAIVDSGMCNLHSIARAVEEVGGSSEICETPDGLRVANRIVLPGVGAFGEAMQNLRDRGMDDAIREQAEQGIPVLGVCLGMQLLMTTGTEGGLHQGLGLIQGDVQLLKPTNGERVPHMGWNEVNLTRESPLVGQVESGSDFYFVHSYEVRCADPDDVVATTPYCGGFTSVIERDNVLGFQFHPEKSQARGLRLLELFVA